MKDKKEMTATGPVRRLGDYLEACFHSRFTQEADMMLQDGRISREQRIAISEALGKGLDAFHESLPESVRMQRMDVPYATAVPMMESYSLSKAIAGISAGIKSVVDWFTTEKKEDPEPSWFSLLKAGDENYVVLTYSNKWEDREEDIISEAAHKSYADYVNTKGFRPQITPFHQPSLSEEFWLKVYKTFKDDVEALNMVVRRVYRDTGAAIAEVDRVVYMNGFSMMIGKVYPDMLEVAEKLASLPDVGSSHAFIATDFMSRENGGKIIKEYWSFEGSPLPRHRAANPLTALTLEEKSMSMSEEDRNWLTSLFGAGRMAKIEANLKDLEPVLDGILAHKGLLDKAAAPADEEEDEEKYPDGQKGAKKEVAETPTPAPVSDAQAVAAEVIKMLNVDELRGVLKGLSDRLDAHDTQLKSVEKIEKTVEKIEKSDDLRIAEALSPVSWLGAGAKSIAQSETTVAPDQEAAKKAVTEDAPKDPAAGSKEKGNDPMALGFWNQFKELGS